MRIRFFSEIALVAALAAAGCSRSFEADVARFHDLPAEGAQTIQVVPADPDRLNGPEFERYADLVGAELRAQGYQPVPKNGDLKAQLSWNLSEPRERIRTRGHGGHFGHGFHGFRGLHGGHGGHGLHGARGLHGLHGLHDGHGGHGLGFGHFGHGGLGVGTRIESQTVRDMRLELTMRRADGEAIFEGRATSTVTESDPAAVVPFMVEALFTDFPGESGRTKTVSVERDTSGAPAKP